MEPDSLVDDDVIACGGWDASFARVLKLQIRDSVAFAKIDTNGDGQEIEETYYVRQDAEWVELGSNSWGTSELAGWAHGYAHGLSRVALAFGGGRYVVPVDSDGEWWFVGRPDAAVDGGTEMPALIE